MRQPYLLLVSVLRGGYTAGCIKCKWILGSRSIVEILNSSGSTLQVLVIWLHSCCCSVHVKIAVSQNGIFK